MFLRVLSINCYHFSFYKTLPFHQGLLVRLSSSSTSTTTAMSYRPNSQGGRRGGGPGGGRSGGGRRGGGGGGRGRGGGGEQRWWDPVWRAERLRQMQAENPVEVLDKNEMWGKMEELINSSEQELIIKKNYGRDGQQTLSDMAYQLNLYL
ncbi:hypothetical protein C5167_046958 [Papaver somniferum]|uniref:Uncharacterized protein n=1 Tax=Papaver somniferum TaxID=3469 RepID=A0A4Y7LIV3_PAPSO|nr:hypothetical protein C5167_046958 [Papaver somniferum]